MKREVTLKAMAKEGMSKRKEKLRRMGIFVAFVICRMAIVDRLQMNAPLFSVDKTLLERLPSNVETTTLAQVIRSPMAAVLRRQ